MNRFINGAAIVIFALSGAAGMAQTVPLGANLERFDYPAPARWYDALSQGRPIRMAYLDLAPTVRANGTTVVLLHGKSFCSASWDETARGFTGVGFRVIAPDQVGFCKPVAAESPRLGRLQVRTVLQAAETAVRRVHIAKLGRPETLGHAPQADAPDQLLGTLKAAIAS